jgi:hypothetical protein
LGCLDARAGYQDDLQSAYHVLALGRFHILSEVLDMGFHALFSDTDVYVIRDPIPMLLEAKEVRALAT